MEIRHDHPGAAVGPVPTPAQLRWQRGEVGLFVHFGVNTYTGREWGDGTESPAIFNPARLDTDQWAQAARDAGAGHMVLTCKHHDGFCLWPSAFTSHSVKTSTWEGGRGDVVARFVRSCEKYGLGYGFYLSPWDRHEPRYGQGDAYNEYYLSQLNELLSMYGSDARELWFDGAIDDASRRRGQRYEFARFFETCARLAPNAVRFGDGGTDVRWIGNERGVAGDPCWSRVKSGVVRYPGDGAPEDVDATPAQRKARWLECVQQLQHGEADGDVWRPGEADVSIRPGWFYHAHEDAIVRSAENLVDLYFKSVGRNTFLLLNVPPTQDGLFHDTDVRRLKEFRAELTRMFAQDHAHGSHVSVRENEVEIELPGPRRFDVLDLREHIELGQRIASHQVTFRGPDGQWRWLIEGQTIGNRKLERLAMPAVATAIRVTCKTRGAAGLISGVGLYDTARG